MNIVTTQFRENYGAHDWDGTGECPQYWKNKGGETYILDSGVCPFKFIEAIEYTNDYSSVTVLNVVESEDLPEHEEWNPPVFVSNALHGKFLCSRTTPNVDGTSYRSEIESKFAMWKLGEGHEITEHEVTYTMENGDHVTGEANLKEWFNRHEKWAV